MKVIFVCHANIYKSPIAEVIFKSLVNNVDVMSAGMYTLPGQKARPNAIKVCEMHNLDLSNHRSKKFYDLDIDESNLILALTCDIRDDIKEKYPNFNVYTVKEYAGEKKYLDMIEPYGESMMVYDKYFGEMKEYLEKIVEIHDF